MGEIGLILGRRTSDKRSMGKGSLFLLLILLIGSPAQSQETSDNRYFVNPYVSMISTRDIRSRSSVTMVTNGSIIEAGSNSFSFQQITFRELIESFLGQLPALMISEGLNPDEIPTPRICEDSHLRFLEQKINLGSICSGTLVSSDVIVTAAHCLRGLNCEENISFIFDNNRGQNSFNNDQRRKCKEVLHVEEGGVDVAIIRIDPPVFDREPISWRRSGSLSQGDNIVAIGNPLGLRQIASPGQVKRISRSGNQISSNLILNKGNSGGGVFSDEERRLEGVVSMAPVLPFSMDRETGCIIPFTMNGVQFLDVSRIVDGIAAEVTGSVFIPTTVFSNELERFTSTSPRLPVLTHKEMTPRNRV